MSDVDSKSLCLLNGEPATEVTIADRGLQYGDGVFRTMLIHKREVVDWPLHRERINADAKTLAIANPNEAAWKNDFSQLLSNIDAPAVCKLILTRGAGQRGYRPDVSMSPTRITRISVLKQHPSSNWTTGVDIQICNTRLGQNPALAGVKHLNRLEQVLASAELTESQSEGLMLNSQQQVICGTMSNLFLVKNNKLYTPRLDLCGVKGVMRTKVLSLAQASGIDNAECIIGLEDLFDADEVFLTNSLIGIWPVRNIDNCTMQTGQITKQLQQQLQHPLIPE